MKRQFRFTKRALDALPPCPENSKAKEIEYSDLEVAGLKVLCNRIGRKSFLFRYVFDGRKRSMKVGGYPETEITDARMKVIERMVTDIGYRDKFAAGVYSGKIEGLMIGLIVSFTLLGFLLMG